VVNPDAHEQMQATELWRAAKRQFL